MTPMADEGTLLLPEGSRLVHIGPYKTGTTAIQVALWACRAAMLDQGVRHLGRTRNPASAVRAVTGLRSPSLEDSAPSIWHWHELVREVRRSREPRVVMSSEFFSRATPQVIRRVVDDLDPGRIRIAVTLRPLARILPSNWQQDIQAGGRTAYEAWLDKLLDPARGQAGSGFWISQRHDQLIDRWAAVVGPERVTAIVVDDRDHGVLLRVFERLLGLRTGTLVANPDLSNRSLTHGEAEAVRAFNVAFYGEGLSKSLHGVLVRLGVGPYLKRIAPGPGEPRSDTPQWALDRAGEIAREMVANIAASGVHVIGDLGSLTVVPTSGVNDDHALGATVPPKVAASMAVGVLLASGLARRAGGQVAETDSIDLTRLSTSQLQSAFLHRIGASVGVSGQGLGARVMRIRSPR